MVAVMEGPISALASINVSARRMEPADLIAWIDDITSPTTAAGEDVVNYNPFDPIADQAIRRDVEFRSEEHTSELQSLMRISYAVFCLKKKKRNIKLKNNNDYILLLARI